MENFNENALENVLNSILGDKKEIDLAFIKEQKWFLENHFVYQITEKEGGTCCYDKASTIVSRLELFFASGAEISFDYTQKYTFHLPKQIFTTHNEIITFYKALVSLFYGKPMLYLEWYKNKLLATK
jgi:hypothetical protein